MLTEMRALLWLTLLGACGGSSATPSDAGSCSPSLYPCGPYGYAMGAVIANLTIQSQHDANGNGSAVDDPVLPVQLADYFRNPNLKALAIIIGSESCVPCQNEQPTLVSLYKGYPAGEVVFLDAIVQNSTGGPADQTVIDNWATQFSVPFDLTADPTHALTPYYPTNSFPSAMAIRTADMKIVYSVTGPADGLQAAIDQIVKP